ncbi:MAG TPA: branched-chain-amino-acid transaminase [Planctomycetia bacterium]|nr:branched-chain-amino-acid transaminase [Planctomycetia bacterium]
MASEQTVWLDGKLVPLAQATVNVYDHGLLYGDGVFEGIRIYNHRILKLRTHLLRLYDSARSIMLTIRQTLDEMDAAVRETVKANGLRDGYIRLVITRGVGSLGVNPLACKHSSTIVIADKIQLYPQEKYERGITMITASTQQKHPACSGPQVKSLNYLPNMMAKLEAMNAGADEALVLNHLGMVAECVGENVFVVKDRGKSNPLVRTPPVWAGLLEGVTRAMAIEILRGQGHAVAEDNFTRHDLYIADEIFLTGTGAEVVPVVKYDGRTIGSGEPGPVTRKLIAEYRRIAEHAPED